MAKKSMIARENKRTRMVAKYAEKRAALKTVLGDLNASDEEKWEAQIALQKLPRDASPVRQQRRCQIPGVPGCTATTFLAAPSVRCCNFVQRLRHLQAERGWRAAVTRQL